MEYTVRTLCFTWGGIIGMALGPFYIISNLIEYFVGCYKFALGKPTFGAVMACATEGKDNQSTLDRLDVASEASALPYEVVPGEEKLKDRFLIFDRKSRLPVRRGKDLLSVLTEDEAHKIGAMLFQHKEVSKNPPEEPPERPQAALTAQAAPNPARPPEMGAETPPPPRHSDKGGLFRKGDEMNNKIYPIAFSIAALVLLLIAILSKMDYGFYTLLRWSVVIACGVNVYHLSKHSSSWGKIISIPLILIIPLFIFAEMQRSEWIIYDIGAMIVISIGILAILALTINPERIRSLTKKYKKVITALIVIAVAYSAYCVYLVASLELGETVRIFGIIIYEKTN